MGVLAIIILVTISGFLYINKKTSCPVTSCPVTSCPTLSCPVVQQSSNRKLETDSSQTRDRRVVNDPLYPPLNRTDEKNFNMVTKEVRSGNLYVNTDDSNDSFRLVGYLSNSESKKDAGGNNWKLFARMKDRHQGEYYIIPSESTISIKLFLTPEIVVSERLRDVFSLPKEMRFNSPMLNTGVYQFSEMPKADLTSVRYM